MNAEIIQYREQQAKNIIKMNAWARKNFFFRLFLLRILPMGFLAGLRVKKIDTETCEITVAYKWLNKNPFRSVYFAVLAMAAELSTGLPAFSFTYHSKPAVSMLVTAMKAEFSKKATGITTFKFNHLNEMQQAIENAIETGEGVTYECLTIGSNDDGKEVARFYLTWSFRTKIS